jgi:hypothetical protein
MYKDDFIMPTSILAVILKNKNNEQNNNKFDFDIANLSDSFWTRKEN